MVIADQFVDDIETVFNKVQTRYNLNMGDFPPVAQFQETLRSMGVSKLAALKLAVIDQLDGILERDIPRLMEALPGVTAGADDAEGAGQLLDFMESGVKVIKHGTNR